MQDTVEVEPTRTETAGCDELLEGPIQDMRTDP